MACFLSSVEAQQLRLSVFRRSKVRIGRAGVFFGNAVAQLKEIEVARKKKVQYEFVEGSRVSGLDPQIIGEELERIRIKNNGKLTANAVLKEAKAKRSKIHRFFEWDDTEAAEQYRLSQARLLVRSVVVSYRADDRKSGGHVRAFVSVVDKNNRQEYMPIDKAMSTKEFRDQVILNALSELEVWKMKYDSYNELAKIHETIDKESKVVKRKIKK